MKRYLLFLIIGMLIFIPAVSAENQINLDSNIGGIIEWLKPLLGFSNSHSVDANLISVASSALATRDIQTQNLTAGSSTNITVTITNNVSQALSLMESLPSGWNLTRISDDASSFKSSTNEWVWFSVGAGVTKTVIYKLSIPSNASAGTYYINGSISNSSGVIANVTWENLIRVTSESQPSQPSAYANRDIQTQNLTAGSSTNITVTMTNNVSQALSLMESLPSGWNLTRISDDASSFKASTNEWVWFSVGAGVTKTVIYKLSIPSNGSAGIYYINGSISNSSGVIANVTGKNIINIINVLSTPVIVSYAPSSPVNDTAPATRTFIITVNQTVNVTWYFNGAPEQTNSSVTAASYTSTTNLAGAHNVTAVAGNANGTDSKTWIWNVAYPAVAPPMIISSAPSSPVSDTAPATRTFNITVNQTVNATWYFNGVIEQSTTTVTSASYTKTTNLTGRHNVTAIAHNANGTAMQTWEWNVTAPQVVPSTPKPKVPRKPMAGKLEVILIPEHPTVYDNVSMEVRLTYPTAGYKVKFGNASIKNNTITVNIDSQEPKGMAAQVITTYSKKYNLGYFSEGTYACEVYINGGLSEDYGFTVLPTSASYTPASSPLSLGGGVGGWGGRR